MVVNYVLLFVAGLLVGFTASRVVSRVRTAHGTLRIDSVHFEKETWRLEINGSLDDLSKKDKVVLVVDRNADLSASQN